jgi:hypothetical protein
VAPKPALVLVPGLGADAGDWSHQIDHLGDVADVTMADVRPSTSRAEIAEAVLSAAPWAVRPWRPFHGRLGGAGGRGSGAAAGDPAYSPQHLARPDAAAIQRRAIEMIGQERFEGFRSCDGRVQIRLNGRQGAFRTNLRARPIRMR